MVQVNKQTAARRATNAHTAPEPWSPWDTAEVIRMLLYGESGSGKTTFWATFPGPILVLLCSGGNRPGELKSINTPEYRAKITPRVINTMSDIRSHLADVINYVTVVLDHASGLLDLLLKEQLGLSEIPVQKTFGMASREQYGTVGIQCKEILRALLNLPRNVVIVAQQRTFGGKDDGFDPEIIKPTVGASLTPSVVGWLNPAVDYICQMYKRPIVVREMVEVVKGQGPTEMIRRATGPNGEKVEYCLRCEAHDTFTTKFRLPRGKRIPDAIVDPNYDKLLKLIRGDS